MSERKNVGRNVGVWIAWKNMREKMEEFGLWKIQKNDRMYVCMYVYSNLVVC